MPHPDPKMFRTCLCRIVFKKIADAFDSLLVGAVPVLSRYISRQVYRIAIHIPIYGPSLHETTNPMGQPHRGFFFVGDLSHGYCFGRGTMGGEIHCFHVV